LEEVEATRKYCQPSRVKTTIFNDDEIAGNVLEPVIQNAGLLVQLWLLLSFRAFLFLLQ